MLFYVLLPKEKQQRCVYYICSLISFCFVLFFIYFLLVKCFNCTVTTEALSGHTTTNNEPGRTGTNQVKPGRTALISPSTSTFFRRNRWGMLCSCTQRLLLALLGDDRSGGERCSLLYGRRVLIGCGFDVTSRGRCWPPEGQRRAFRRTARPQVQRDPETDGGKVRGAVSAQCRSVRACDANPDVGLRVSAFAFARVQDG